MQEFITTRMFLGVPVAVSDRADAVARLDQALACGELLKVAFANAHTLNFAARHGELRAALQGFYVLNDGLGLDIASRIKFGQRFPENLNGTDFVPLYLARSQHALRLYLLGATADVAAAAAAVFRRDYPRHAVVGFHHGYLKSEDAAGVCAEIAAAEADVVLVAMGNPLQELWIAKNAPATGAKLLIGVGALFDFVSGRTPRAPGWVQSLRCEWIYRLALEPRRLWRRYLIGNALFLASILRERRGARIGPDDKPGLQSTP